MADIGKLPVRCEMHGIGAVKVYDLVEKSADIDLHGGMMARKGTDDLGNVHAAGLEAVFHVLRAFGIAKRTFAVKTQDLIGARSSERIIRGVVSITIVKSTVPAHDLKLSTTPLHPSFGVALGNKVYDVTETHQLRGNERCGPPCARPRTSYERCPLCGRCCG